MRTIWKFDLTLADESHVEMPDNAKILHVDHQPPDLGTIQIWAEVETENPKNMRTLFVRGTGHELPSPVAKYIGTVLASPYTWHVFDGGYCGHA